MKENRINENVMQKISENGQIKYWKKAKYDMNVYYTKLAENIYEQMGVKHVKNNIQKEGGIIYFVTDDIQKDKQLYMGNQISNNTDLSKIKDDLKLFLQDKQIKEEDINGVWNDFLKLILADIQTCNPDRHGKNWGVLINGNNAELAPNFDYDYTFSQNEYAMKGVAEAIENKNTSIKDKMMKTFNVKKFTGYLKNTIDNIGLEVGYGRRILIDLETKKYRFQETSKYIQKELGEAEYMYIMSRIDIQKALPEEKQKGSDIYSLLAKLHHQSIMNRTIDPNVKDYER